MTATGDTRERMERFQSKEFWAGVLFVCAGLLVLILGADLRQGSARSMGPGYVPRMLAWTLIGLGAVIALRGFSARAERIETAHLRPFLLIALAVGAFTTLFIETPLFPWNGLAPASVALVVVAALARGDWRIGETLISALVLLTLCTGIFKVGLGMTFPIMRGIW